MKKIILIMLLVSTAFVGNAQDRKDHRERIKALKTAFITEGLDLTAREAQQFWPIYNSFEEERRKLYRKERADVEDLECLNEAEAEAKLKEYVQLERQDYLLKQQYYNDLKKIFSAKRIMRLKQVEEEFNEKLMREYRSRRAEKKS